MPLYARPFVTDSPRARLLPSSSSPMMAGLGDLGDTAVGNGAQGALNTFQNLLLNHIISKAGPSALSNAQASGSFVSIFGAAAAIWSMGDSGGLPADQQAYWNQWKAAAQGINSDYNIYYTFGQLVAQYRSHIITGLTSQQQQGSWWLDPNASAAEYTLMDTSQTGTTWYGGQLVTSKLNNQQWSTLFGKAWDCLARGIRDGVLPLTYLEVLSVGLLAAPAQRRFPVFRAPGNPGANDPQAVAFRAALKQLGWNNAVHQWYSWTSQAWVAQNDAAEAQDASYSSAITVLRYTSGAALLDQIAAKVEDYWKARKSAADNLAAFDALANGPLGENVSQADRAAMAQVRASFQDTDGKAQAGLTPAGLWDAQKAQGIGLEGINLGELGAYQMLLYGVVAITILGLLAYLVATMTKAGRDAAEGYRKTADSVLATVDTLKASCARSYEASPKGPADEQAYQDCLAKTQALYNTIPDPPDTSDPLGLGKITILAGVAIAGIVLINALKKKKN
jgi:hypothetical protein